MNSVLSVQNGGRNRGGEYFSVGYPVMQKIYITLCLYSYTQADMTEIIPPFSS